MGEVVEFPSNGHTASGYLAVPESGSGPGLIVIQEWWGLVPHIKEVCDRFAAEGFVALAPDLYRGETTTEPDEAGKLMMALNIDEASKDMGGAVDHLLGLDEVTTEHVGVTGFCMGGGLALKLAADRPDAVSACVPFYGLIPWANAQPDWSTLEAAVLGHYAENDDFFSPAQARELESTLRGLGKEAEIVVHDDAGHAFFNDHRPEAHHPEHAREAFESTVDFLRSHVD